MNVLEIINHKSYFIHFLYLEVKKHVDSTADISTLHMKDTPFMNQQPPRLPLSSTIYEGQVVSQYPNIVPTNLLPAVGKIPLSGHVLNLSSSFDEVNLLQSSPTVVRPPLPMQHQLGLRVSHHDVKPNSIPIQPPFASMPNNSVHRSAFPMVEPSMRPNSIMSHSPSFGAVGQNMRGPPGLQQPVQPGHWPMGSRNVQHGMSQPRVIGPEHAMASGQVNVLIVLCGLHFFVISTTLVSIEMVQMMQNLVCSAYSQPHEKDFGILTVI